jgi:predicted nucleic acid-binding protein
LIFIDTTVWVGSADSNDEFHDSSAEIVKAVRLGALPLALITDFIIDETVTILGKRKGVGAEQAREVGRKIVSSPRVFTVFIDEALLIETLERYPNFRGKLSFTDVCSVVVMEKYGVKEVYSHDTDFNLHGFRRKESSKS